MYRIMIVEDDKTIASAMEKHISQWGCEVKKIEDFTKVQEVFFDYKPQLVLMDISLPFFNGYHWCAEIRKTSKVPIIFISSSADNMNIVMAVNMGADDFIAKPFDLDVLNAKIQALLRRTYDFQNDNTFIEIDGLMLDTESAELIYNGEKLNITKNEYKILRVLMEQRGKIVSREDLMVKLWETDSFVDDNTLTVNITRLRKKLEGIGFSEFIKTKKGLGYMVE